MNFPKKSLGQNFLIDKNIIKKIVNLKNIKNKNIIEIGPGKGALTNEILNKKPKSLILIEKDIQLSKNLKEKYKNNKLVQVFCDDILDFNLKKINSNKFIIFGNLPYNISSQILIKFIRFNNVAFKFSDLIFMFQKELGDKIIGNYPSTNYGRLSIIRNYKFEIIKNFLVSPNCFFPKPKVNSMVIHFHPKRSNIKIKKITNLEKITNIFFSNKRKMINKNIKKILNERKIKLISDLKLNDRPLDLKPEIYYKITELYEKS